MRSAWGPVPELSVPLVWTLVAALCFGIGWLDYETGWEISFSILYFIPVSLAAWRLSRTAALGTSLVCSVVWLMADVSTHPAYSHPLIPAWNGLVRLGFFVILTVQLSFMRGTLEREQELARRDTVTGAWNRRSFQEALRAEISRSRRYGHSITLAYIDIDGFKRVNDTLGHHAGDALLTQVAQVLRENVRESDVVARLGGDEFAVLFPVTSPEEGRSAATKLHAALRTAAADARVAVTFSIGLSTLKAPWGSVDHALQEADRHMYAAKNEGGDRIRQSPGDPDGATAPDAIDAGTTRGAAEAVLSAPR